MDTLSHALLGIAVAGLSDHPLSFNDPIYLASLIGAQAPDFDIIAQIRGNFAYLRQHRAFSHSVPGLMMWSALISVGFFLFMPTAALEQVFVWSFLGGLTHIIIDFFNAHGVAIFWPFNRGRKSFSLLNVFDPLLLVIMLVPFIQGLPARETSLLFFASVGMYAFIRYALKMRATTYLRRCFSAAGIVRILVLPSLKSVLLWDFVIETHEYYFVGQLGAIQPILKIHTELTKKALSSAELGAQKTVLGEFFASFTPFSYCTEHEDDVQNTKLVRIYDLRYFLNQSFLHSATIVLGHDEQPCESYIQTYGRKIKIPC
ncbi:putative protein YfhP [Sporomusa carbonis]|uniref:metal-dependent hydrolase n=1 Tax=Sporomusa carbonis TaxID=3076075 RepID=UPI003A6C73C4